MSSLLLKSFRLKNFKAVRDSGVVRFTPLTVFIGNNGSGKSSLIEGLETLKAIAGAGLDKAMQRWKGYEHIYNQATHRALTRLPTKARDSNIKPMSFEFSGVLGAARGQPYSARVDVNTSSPAFNDIFIEQEKIILPKVAEIVRRKNKVDIQENATSPPGFFVFKEKKSIEDGLSLLGDYIRSVSRWQFLSMVPQNMGSPLAQDRATDTVNLSPDGSNISQYLQEIRTLDQSAFEGIIETLKYVLPYAKDLQPRITSELERNVYLSLTEADFKVPGWLLSTGTLRVVALLAVLRHPNPPPLIVIEEIENGLDPRTINLVVEEIRNAVEDGRTQVIVTTHSPYLLDLLDLSHLVLTERVEGESVFTRPADQKTLKEWAKKFTPGRLYVMDRIHSETKK